MWRTSGSENSSLSPSGNRFWIEPSRSRTLWGAPCSALLFLWLCSQDLPAVDGKSCYEHKTGVARTRICLCELCCFLPLEVHQHRQTRCKSSWLSRQVLSVWFPCSPHRPSRRRCSPRWTLRPGTLGRGTVHLKTRGDHRRLALFSKHNNGSICVTRALRDLLWLDNSLSNDSFHVKGSSSFNLPNRRQRRIIRKCPKSPFVLHCFWGISYFGVSFLLDWPLMLWSDFCSKPPNKAFSSFALQRLKRNNN